MKDRIIAFYLPQFHPFKENDEWWGKGFTEWTNVGKAKPLFKGHDQPRVPTELGYYDLRMPEVREAQAEMARYAGVEGFMYWHYWFGNGRTLMADIFQEVLESGKPDFPFCLGWANHTWYAKTWNGAETETKKTLIEQTYPGIEDAALYFKSLLPAFKDKRYIKVDGKPLFFVFSPIDLPDEYIAYFRKAAKDAGLPGLYLVGNIFSSYIKKEDVMKKGFDAVTFQRTLKQDFARKCLRKYKYINGVYKLFNKLKGAIVRRPPFMEKYEVASEVFCTEQEKEIDVIPTVLPQWDHTPRSGWNGILLVDAKPKYFKQVMLRTMNMIKHKPEQHRIIFLKSWNEWGEGNYMEPDITNGRGYIEALREAVHEMDSNQIVNDGKN